jgi:Mg-chelatase subunit ChlD
LARTVPQGFTPLYRTIVAGMDKVATAGDNGQVRAMVVITDGEDTSSQLNRQDTIAAIGKASRETGVRLFIVATGEATCNGVNGLRALTDAGHGGCFEAGLAQVANTTTTLFESLWKGR